MEVDRVPLSQLPSRYGIARSALYTRLKDLKIEPEKQGKRAFLDASQLQLLDELHSHLQNGGTTGEFLKQRENERPGQSRTDSWTEESSALVQDSPGQISLTQPGALVAVVEAIVKRLVPSAGSRLSYLRELEEAYEKGWLLSTKEVADLLGLSPKTVRIYGKEFEDAGFLFTRAGIRKGGKVAWAIEKRFSRLGAAPPQHTQASIKEAFSGEFDPEPEDANDNPKQA